MKMHTNYTDQSHKSSFTFQTEPLSEDKQNKAYPLSYETFSPALIKTGRHPTSAERLEKTKEMFSRVAEFTRHASWFAMHVI